MTTPRGIERDLVEAIAGLERGLSVTDRILALAGGLPEFEESLRPLREQRSTMEHKRTDLLAKLAELRAANNN